jgi:hypothetical protein
LLCFTGFDGREKGLRVGFVGRERERNSGWVFILLVKPSQLKKFHLLLKLSGMSFYKKKKITIMHEIFLFPVKVVCAS